MTKYNCFLTFAYEIEADNKEEASELACEEFVEGTCEGNNGPGVLPHDFEVTKIKKERKNESKS